MSRKQKSRYMNRPRACRNGHNFKFKVFGQPMQSKYCRNDKCDARNPDWRDE